MSQWHQIFVRGVYCKYTLLCRRLDSVQVSALRCNPVRFLPLLHTVEYHVLLAVLYLTECHAGQATCVYVRQTNKHGEVDQYLLLIASVTLNLEQSAF